MSPVKATVIGFGGGGVVGATLGVGEADLVLLDAGACELLLELPPLEQPATNTAAAKPTVSTRERRLLRLLT